MPRAAPADADHSVAPRTTGVCAAAPLLAASIAAAATAVIAVRAR